MSRLGKIINVAEEKSFDISKTNIVNSFTVNKGSLDETTKIAMNRICARFKNEYIIDPAKTKVLINSIEKEGLLQPIVLMNIKDYLETGKIAKDEIDYYEDKLSKGFDFFIVAGHRRFRAYASLLSDKLIETNEDLEQFYLDIKDENCELGVKFKVEIGKKNEEKWTKILSIVANPENLDEILAYLHSNITARAPSTFEVVTSVYNQLVRTGTLDEALEKYRKTARDTVNILLIRYIKDVYAIDIPKSRISSYLRIGTNISPEITKCIFDGKVVLREVENILPVYQKIEEDGLLESLVDDVKSGSFTAKKWLDKYKESKEEKPSKKEILEMLYKAKNGEISIDEIIKVLEA